MAGDFQSVAATATATLDELALALAAEFRPVLRDRALEELDRLGAALSGMPLSTPLERAHSLQQLLGEAEGFAGDRERYDHPDNSMLDLVLERRRGLPILLCAVYVEVARRAGIAVSGVGLPGHFLAGILEGETVLLLDPFSGGRLVVPDVEPSEVRAWHPHETALRMLNNLVASFGRRGDLSHAIRAAELRVMLPLEGRLQVSLEAELRALRSRLN